MTEGIPAHQQLDSQSLPIYLLMRNHFEIPMNQREYRWEEDSNLAKFWDDLLITVKETRELGPAHLTGHFLGAIVVIGGTDTTIDKWQVIDGQQRLTTITILSRCMRSYVDRIEGARDRDKYEHILLDCYCDPAADYAPRIILNRAHEFYAHSLLDCANIGALEEYWSNNHNEKSDVEANIIVAFRFFHRKIQEYLNESKNLESDLVDLIENFTKHFYALRVRTTEYFMAYRLFETLNERGLGLTQADLIRNQLMQFAKPHGQSVVERVASQWGKLVDSYENQPGQSDRRMLELPQIIQFSFSYRHKPTNKEKIFEFVSNELRSGREEPSVFVDEFVRDSQNWSAFLLGDLAHWETTTADMQFAITDPLWKEHATPFIMAAMNRFSDSIEDLEVCFKLCEHYLFREGIVCKQSVSNLQKFFTQAAVTLRSGSSMESTVGLFGENSSDSYFVECFSTAKLSNMKQAFYVMWKIENALMSSVGFRPREQGPAQHVEHIMPRNPDSSWGGIEQDETFKAYLSRIGNFLILDGETNRHIKNRSFDYKVQNKRELDYTHSNELRLPAELIEHSGEWLERGAWTFDSIDARQKHLAREYAIRVWPLSL